MKVGLEPKTQAGHPAHISPDEGLVFFPVAAVCQILPKGVVAVLGPSSSPASSSIISNICGEKEVSAPSGWETLAGPGFSRSAGAHVGLVGWCCQ